MTVGIHKDLYKHIEATGARRPFKELGFVANLSFPRSHFLWCSSWVVLQWPHRKAGQKAAPILLQSFYLKINLGVCVSVSYQHAPITDVSMTVEQQLPGKIFSCLKKYMRIHVYQPIHTLEYTTGNRIILWLNVNSFVAKTKQNKKPTQQQQQQQQTWFSHLVLAIPHSKFWFPKCQHMISFLKFCPVIYHFQQQKVFGGAVKGLAGPKNSEWLTGLLGQAGGSRPGRALWWLPSISHSLSHPLPEQKR